MSYKVMGKGKKVVLLHGSMINNPWAGFEKELAKSYQVFIPDLPGFGASDSIPNRLHNTDLFAECLGEFIKLLNLRNIPIVSFSLGTIIALKVAVNGDTYGKLILVGLPGKMSGIKFRVTRKIPVNIRRLLVSTSFGKRKLLIPILRQNIGKVDNNRDEQLLKQLSSTDPKSLVDIDVINEVEKSLTGLLKGVKNKMIFMYGEKDPLIETTKELINKSIIIPDGEHNVFRSKPEETLKIIKTLIK